MNNFEMVKNKKIPEDFLSYLWRFRLIRLPLISAKGQAIWVKKPGVKNIDGGPDFSNALIKIGETTWAGHIEIHRKSSDWIKHNHHLDKKYENVILHVVLEDDLGDNYQNFRPVAVLELKSRFDFKRYSKYLGFMQNQGWIPCERSIHQVSELTKSHFLHRLAIERIERRFINLNADLVKNKSDFEQLFHVQLFKSFGFKTNATAFELLAKAIPVNLILKHSKNLTQIEALLFGQAGMLNKSFKDDYPKLLKSEYGFLKHKFALKPISVHLWQYLRLRPSNFPTIRIAQLAQLLHKQDFMLSKFTDIGSINELLNLFEISASEYWDQHYHFDKKTKKSNKNLGTKATESIIINGIVPIFFIYGHYTAKPAYSEKAMQFLECLKGENNAITKKWATLNLPIENALQTQALIELKTQYCDLKRCLECELGCELLNKS
mgnify:CR=1 FL=1